MATAIPISGHRETLLQLLRVWIKAAIVTPPAPSVADQIVQVLDADGARPIGSPYMSVKILMLGAVIGTDERVSGVDSGGDPVVSVRGLRRSTFTVYAFGGLAHDWIEEVKLSKQRDSIRELLNTAGLAINLLGSGMQDRNEVVGTRWESRAAQDFEVTYTYLGIEEPAVELTTYEHSGTYESDVSADLVTSTTITV